MLEEKYFMLFNRTTTSTTKGFKVASPQDIQRISNNSISTEDVLRALTSNYSGTFYFNLKTGEVGFLDLCDRIVDAFGPEISKHNRIDSYARMYAEKFVHPDYVDEFISVVSEVNLRKVMADHTMYTYRYVGFINDKPNYFLVTIARISDNPDHIFVGFSDINEQVLAEKARTAALESATSVKNEFLIQYVQVIQLRLHFHGLLHRILLLLLLLYLLLNYFQIRNLLLIVLNLYFLKYFYQFL